MSFISNSLQVMQKVAYFLRDYILHAWMDGWTKCTNSCIYFLEVLSCKSAVTYSYIYFYV